jgi:flagellar basal body-associated protein FliL
MLSKQPSKKPQVSPKEQMSSNTPNILLIVIIVILVGVLGVAVGYIYFGSLNHPNTIIE